MGLRVIKASRPAATDVLPGVLWLIATVGWVCVAGCGHKGVPPPSFHRALEAFSDPAPPKEEETLDMDVYLDVSESMQGFVAEPASNFRRVLGTLLDSAQAGQYRIQRFLFADTIRSADSYKSADLLNPTLYGGRDTPIGGLLQRMLQQGRHKRLNLLLTDLVQSDKGIDQAVVIEMLQELVKKDLDIRLLGFRSSFRGRYFVENRAGCPAPTLSLDVGQSLPGMGRPFYLLIVAPNRASVRRLERSVLGHVRAQQVLSPTETAVAINDVRFNPPVGGARIWQPVRKTESGVGIGATQRLYSAFDVNADAGDKAGLPLRYSVEKRLPLDSAEKLDIEASQVNYANGKFDSPQPVEVPRRFGADSVGGGVIEVNFFLPQAPRGAWAISRLRMRAGVGNLSPPRWLGDWSTDTDCLANHADRTYRLEYFGRTLVNAVTEKAVFCDHYIAVRRRD